MSETTATARKPAQKKNMLQQIERLMHKQLDVVGKNAALPADQREQIHSYLQGMILGLQQIDQVVDPKNPPVPGSYPAAILQAGRNLKKVAALMLPGEPGESGGII